jgi:hypothetical protein
VIDDVDIDALIDDDSEVEEAPLEDNEGEDQAQYFDQEMFGDDQIGDVDFD